MIIVVDGYNLLKQIITKDIIGDKDRNAFIAQLGIYGRYKKHSITVVFDGGQLDWPHTENRVGVLVVYSGSRQTADQYIYKYFKTDKIQDALLVSSDTGLRRLVSDLGIFSLDSGSFYQFVKRFLSDYKSQNKKYSQSIEASTRDKTIVRLHADRDHEVDSYMEMAARNIVTKKEDRSGESRFNGVDIFDKKKLSRADQKLFNILKKL